jgi:L-seryl-tRNA(Ser) seleniumtransferase
MQATRPSTGIQATVRIPGLPRHPGLREHAAVTATPAPIRPPSVDRLARSLAGSGLPHAVCVQIARAAIAVAAESGQSVDSIAEALVDDRLTSLLQPVVNGTGVLLHTNLGRAPLAVAVEARASNLEFDLATGARGSRHRHAGQLLADTCGAEAGLVVNNCAGAMLLVLAALATGRAVTVSRGEAVEIGGGFRIPDVMAQSGCQLVDVGTTNRTRLRDYQQAAERHDVAVHLKLHPSNFSVVGFTEATTTNELASLAAPVVVDLGSGLLDARCPWLPGGPPPWLADEPAARQELDAGAGLVVFSGDKLLGGPQAGVIVGRSDLVAACAAHPLARALRAGGLVLSALQQIALAYLGKDLEPLWFWRAATTPVATLHARGDEIVRRVGRDDVSVVASEATPGAGCAPGVVIPSVALRLPGDHSAVLRRHRPPVIGHVHDDATWLDLRSIDPGDDATVSAALAALPTH